VKAFTAPTAALPHVLAIGTAERGGRHAQEADMGFVIIIEAALAVVAVAIAVAAALHPGRQGQPTMFNGPIDWRL
jgi:hypothetical protein